MPVLEQPAQPTHEIPGATFTTLASPSTAASSGSVWRLRLEPDQAAVPHRLTSEEIFVVTGGAAHGLLGDEPFTVRRDQILVVPPGVDFELHSDNGGFEAIVYMAAGGQAIISDGEPFTPPWAE
jgi:mannose-6-phosphate isomerase-like protein (cupin superfamily)